MTDERAPIPSPEQVFIDNAQNLIKGCNDLIANLPSRKNNRLDLNGDLDRLKKTRDTRAFWEQKGRNLTTDFGNPLEPTIQQKIKELTALKPEIEQSIVMAEEWLKELAVPVESSAPAQASEPVTDVPPVQSTPEPPTVTPEPPSQPEPEPEVETQPKPKTPDEIMKESRDLFAEAAKLLKEGEWPPKTFQKIMADVISVMSAQNQILEDALKEHEKTAAQPKVEPQPEPQRPPEPAEYQPPTPAPQPDQENTASESAPKRDASERIREAVGNIADAVGAAWAGVLRKDEQPQVPADDDEDPMGKTQPIQVKENKAAADAAENKATTAEVRAMPEEPIPVATPETPVPPAPKPQPEQSAPQPTSETAVGAKETRVTNLEDALGLQAGKSVDNGVADRTLATLNKALTNPDWDVLEDLIYDQGAGVVLLTRGNDQDLVALETALKHKTTT